uniref:Uncharacterized protein n=1 Tax=Porphyridium purpureum TaxID=35688 RepID=W0RYJ7_PORPP|nr:hypothetical protein Y721_p049 [Porphyridium purpureum]BAO23759.1 hypothetical protein [Porphyridium purpureum]
MTKNFFSQHSTRNFLNLWNIMLESNLISRSTYNENFSIRIVLETFTSYGSQIY